jgi:hypothetical protein
VGGDDQAYLCDKRFRITEADEDFSRHWRPFNLLEIAGRRTVLPLRLWNPDIVQQSSGQNQFFVPRFMEQEALGEFGYPQGMGYPELIRAKMLLHGCADSGKALFHP